MSSRSSASSTSSRSFFKVVKILTVLKVLNLHKVFKLLIQSILEYILWFSVLCPGSGLSPRADLQLAFLWKYLFAARENSTSFCCVFVASPLALSTADVGQDGRCCLWPGVPPATQNNPLLVSTWSVNNVHCSQWKFKEFGANGSYITSPKCSSFQSDLSSGKQKVTHACHRNICSFPQVDSLGDWGKFIGISWILNDFKIFLPSCHLICL